MTEPALALRRQALRRAGESTHGTHGVAWGVCGAVAAVAGFWWLATGLTLAMRNGAGTRVATGAGATVLAVIGAGLVVITRGSRTPRAALGAFFGGALLWGWVAVLFYGGWVTGVAPLSPAGPAGSWLLAVQAIGATAYSDALALAVIALVAVATVRGPNRTALWTLTVFWVTHQLARLNLFAGVRHSGADLLPHRLAYLGMFFGPPRNSFLLPLSIVGLATFALWMGRRALRAREPYVRQAALQLAVLSGLAVLEHAALGMLVSMPLWAPFGAHAK